MTKKRVEELGATWEDVDARVPKPEDAMIDNIYGIVIVILLIFVGIVVVLMQILGPIVRDIAVVILLSFAIIFIVVICPIAMIWGVRVDERKNAERIRLAEEHRRLRETGQSE
jgi:fatty acid desaturase